MSKQKIGVRLESLGLPLRRGLHAAERLGVAGVQVDAVGDLSPRSLSQTGRREFGHLLRAHSLQLTALGCPLRHGLDTAAGLEARIDHVRQVLALSFDLGVHVVVVPCGPIPEDANHPQVQLLREALLALGQHGDRVGAQLALDTGMVPGEFLRSFLERFDTGGLGVHFNPAGLVANGLDPYETARALPGRLLHAYANDARPSGVSRALQEVALGHGDLDWMRLLSVLEEIEYRGWLTISREGGNSRQGDVTAGVAFLRRLGVGL